MASLKNRLFSAFSPTPLGGDLPLPPNVISLADRTKKSESRLGALAGPGTVAYSGFLHYPTEKDAAWSSQFARDETILEMSNNPIIGGVLRQIAMFIRQVEWTVEDADDSDEAKKISEFYKKQLDGMRNLWPGETTPQALTFLTWGWSALEIIYKRTDDGRIGWDEWRLIPQETRWGWRFDGNENPTHLVQLNPQDNREIPIPLTKCIHIRDTSRNNSPEGFTLLRIAYDAYFYRSGFQQLEGTLFERFGGVQVARLPANDIDLETEAYRDLKQIVTTLGINAQTGLVLSSDRDPATGEFYQDFEIEAPASGATVPSADPIITRYANEMVGVFGAAVTRTGQDGSGSYALADVQSNIFLRNMASYLDLIGDSIQNQAFIRLAQMPYNNFPLDKIPKLKHGRLDQPSLAELGAYLVALAQAGVIHDSPELRIYTHNRAAIPVPTSDVIQEEMDEQEKKEEEASQQKISPLASQQGNSALPKKGEKTDPQAARQDKVPVKTKK